MIIRHSHGDKDVSRISRRRDWLVEGVSKRWGSRGRGNADRQLSIVAADVNRAIELIDIEGSCLRHRTNQGRSTVGETTISRLLNKNDTSSEIAVFQINRVRPVEAHPLAIVDRYPAEKIADRIKLKGGSMVSRAANGGIGCSKA